MKVELKSSGHPELGHQRKPLVLRDTKLAIFGVRRWSTFMKLDRPETKSEDGHGPRLALKSENGRRLSRKPVGTDLDLI